MCYLYIFCSTSFIETDHKILFEASTFFEKKKKQLKQYLQYGNTVESA